MPDAEAADTGSRLYVYRDERGGTHVDTTLPPAYAQAGYQVLDGRTLKPLYRVEPALSAEQQARQAQEQKKITAAANATQRAEDLKAQERAAQQNRDLMLLQTYASNADIERLRDNKLEGLGLILRATQNTIGHLRGNLKQMDATLAEHKAEGRAPPARLVNSRAQTAADLASQELASVRTVREQALLRARFDADLERYRHLTGAAPQLTPQP